MLTGMQPIVTPVTLRGTHATLHPMAQEHTADLAEAVADQDIWRLWYTAIPAPGRVGAEIDRRLGLMAAGSMLPFTVEQHATGKMVGMTTFMNVDSVNRRVEIGSTWYRPTVQRTAVNTECKRLLLGHAFDSLGVIAVEFRTHFFNHQSRAGIERLGAKLDGVLRNHLVMPNGTLRDTAVYSITVAEWPTVKAHLDWQLTKPRS